MTALALAVVGCDRDPTAPSGRSHGGGIRSADIVSRELVASIDAGPQHACAVTVGGHVYCWGDDLGGRADVPAGLDGVVQVSASYGHTCALKSNGTVVCWGSGGNGETAVPSGLNDAVEVSAGGTYTCARRSNGVDLCWGTDFSGEAVIPGLSNLAQLSAGYTHTCAIKSNFTGACWGTDDSGESDVPADLGTISQIDAGLYFHTCAVTSAATVRCWGWDASGRTTPPAGLTGVTNLSVGFDHACAVHGGSVSCWGANVGHQLDAPTDLPGVTQVAAGGEFTCALTSAGAVRCWGKHDLGQTSVPSNIVQAEQTIAFTSTPPSPALLNGTYSVSATATSGLSVNLTSLTPAVCLLNSSGVASFIAVGTCTFAANQSGNGLVRAASQVTQSFHVVYSFSGWSGSTSETEINAATAGSAVPFGFSLGGALGLDILAPNSPWSVGVMCDGTVPGTDIAPTQTAGASGLRYDASTNRYVYTWKTDKSWGGTCRRLVLALKDGTTHIAVFRFK